MRIIITIENNYESVNVEVIENEDEICHEFDDETVSPYARFFGPNEDMAIRNNYDRLFFLKLTQDRANDLLRMRGYLFLNDVYEMLGMERSKAGQLVGWVYDEKNPIGDNYVDFGIYDSRNERFVNGYYHTALLDFNVDGNILDYLK